MGDMSIRTGGAQPVAAKSHVRALQRAAKAAAATGSEALAAATHADQVGIRPLKGRAAAAIQVGHAAEEPTPEAKAARKRAGVKFLAGTLTGGAVAVKVGGAVSERCTERLIAKGLAQGLTRSQAIEQGVGRAMTRGMAVGTAIVATAAVGSYIVAKHYEQKETGK